MKYNKTYLAVNMTLKDGTVLKEAAIFPIGEKGEYCINSIKDIEAKFNQQDFISFQTSMINGKFHPSNVEKYEIVEVDVNRI